MTFSGMPPSYNLSIDPASIYSILYRYTNSISDQTININKDG
jgi:hypothetical protein